MEGQAKTQNVYMPMTGSSLPHAYRLRQSRSLIRTSTRLSWS